MKKTIIKLVTFSTLLISCSSTKKIQKEEVNILFIGNSLTYYNDMPQIIQKILDTEKTKYKVSQSTYSGISLTQHLNRKMKIITRNNIELLPLGFSDTSETVKLLLLKKWDFVVLQDGTVRLLIPEVKEQLVIPAIIDFKKKLKNTNTEFVLFKTWPTIDTFPKQHCYPKGIINIALEKDMCCSPIIKSIEDEVSLINYAYDTVALASNIPTVPITDCFMEIIKNHPNINLYADKYSHPSILGAYLNACVFYKFFTKQNASEIKYRSGIDKKTAKIIQEVVDKYYH